MSPLPETLSPGRRLVLRALFAAACAAVLTGLAPNPSRAAAAPIRIVATTGMIADIVRSVGASRVEVRQLMGAGVDPHLYKATRSDISTMIDADMVFYNGLLLEGKMTDAFERVAASGKPVYAVTELIDESSLITPEGSTGHFDPHVWMDPRSWMKAVEVVRDRLSAFDPGNAGDYAANAARLLEDIAALDEYAKGALERVPASQRILVTAHDAFSYFGKRYGFEVHGIQGISTESEAGLKSIETLVNLIVEKRLPAVFVESTISERSIEALVAGAKARGHTLSIGGRLFSDAMGPPGTYEGTYIGMIDHNVTEIAAALGGMPPKGGLSGRLARATSSPTPEVVK